MPGIHLVGRKIASIHTINQTQTSNTAVLQKTLHDQITRILGSNVRKSQAPSTMPYCSRNMQRKTHAEIIKIVKNKVTYIAAIV